MIGTMNEMSLHAALKELYYQPCDIVEGKVGNYVIDVVQDNRLVEIQTGNFSAVRDKLTDLLAEHTVHLVYPVPAERYIVQVAPETGELLGKRKSPKKGTVYDVFSELVRIPTLLQDENFSLEVVMVVEEELRCPDGKGSWRRRGVSIIDRRLVKVVERIKFGEPSDFVDLIPDKLADPFSNKELAQAAKIPVTQARRMTYTLRKAKLLQITDKRGNELLHSRSF